MENTEETVGMENESCMEETKRIHFRYTPAGRGEGTTLLIIAKPIITGHLPINRKLYKAHYPKP